MLSAGGRVVFSPPVFLVVRILPPFGTGKRRSGGWVNPLPLTSRRKRVPTREYAITFLSKYSLTKEVIVMIFSQRQRNKTKIPSPDKIIESCTVRMV